MFKLRNVELITKSVYAGGLTTTYDVQFIIGIELEQLRVEGYYLVSADETVEVSYKY